jgi:hypothetical protein
MEILNTLGQLGSDFANLGRELKLYPLLLSALLPAAWIAWWLWAVNWRKAFPALAQGAWVPLLLLMLVSALVWSRIAPSNVDLGFMQLYNFWWQLGAVGIFVGVALLCGWLQLYFGWTPPEINFDPPSGHDDGHDAHGHEAHGHESAHAHH